MPTQSFNEAMTHARDNYETSRRGILLGNGFSRAYSNSIFSYNSLADEAVLPGLSLTKEELFDGLGTRNFESILEKLGTAATVHSVYGADPDLLEQITDDRRIIRAALANVIAERHPRVSTELEDDEVEHARRFLSNFQFLFTLNYDLLLYWVISRPIGPSVPTNDGFEWPTTTASRRLIWKLNPTYPQRVFYLHGALHLFVESKKVRKLAYGSGGPIIENVRDRLSEGGFPLVVTEGTRAEKETRIERSAYLRHASRKFAGFNGVLFVHGVSMSKNDDHILEFLEIGESEVPALYVGVHGTGSGARAVRRRAEEIVERRADAGNPIELQFYRAETANIWRDPD